MVASTSSRTRRALSFLFCRFLAYITSTIYVRGFRIQSLRPFMTRNVNSMKLDMSDDYLPAYEYSSPRLIQPDVLQRDAILCKDPAILVVAGPGSGKTRVMAARLAYLLKSGTCMASECLVISFTSSAATNLLDKTKEICVKSGSVASTVGVVCDTFHGFCNTVIKENLHLVMDSSKGFYIASDEDQTRIMTDIMDCNGMSSSRAEVKNILPCIRYWKELGLGYLGVRKNSLVGETQIRAYKLYPLYQSKLKSMSALDFGDLLLCTLRLFRQHPQVLDQYRSRFRHILVDEFQDVSPAQYDILRMLVMGSTSARFDMAGGEAGGLTAEEGATDTPRRSLTESKAINRVVNVFCAGDDDQSIYGYRGAKVELMQRFRFDFPGSRVMKFGVSYRLPDAICKATQSFISTSVDRIPKPLVSGHLSYGPSDSEEENGVNNMYPGKPLDLKIIDQEGVDDFSQLSVASSRASIEIRGMRDEEDEVNWIVSYLKDKMTRNVRMQKEHSLQLGQRNPISENSIQRNVPPDHSIVILTRYGAQLRLLEDRLKNNKVPFSSRNFGLWNQQAEYSSPLNLLRLLASPDDDVAFRAALDNDIITASISTVELEAVIMPLVREISRKKRNSLLEAARECVLTKRLGYLHEKAITEFLRKFEFWSSEVKDFTKGARAEKIVTDILKSAFPLRWNAIHVAAARLSSSAAGYASLNLFIEAVRLEGVFEEDSSYKNKEINKDPNTQESSYASGPSSSQNTPQRTGIVPSPKLTIWLMAMHAAKGLEFDEVILPFWSKGTAMDQEEPNERKIAFMALTRAKERVMVSYAKTKRVNHMQRVPCGAALFVDSLLHIPGLKMTHEDIDTQSRRNSADVTAIPEFSRQQQQSLYESKSTYSGSNKDTYSILNEGPSSSSSSSPNSVQVNPYSKYKQAAPATPPNVQYMGTASTVLNSKAPLETRPTTLPPFLTNRTMAATADKKELTHHPFLISSLTDVIQKFRSGGDIEVGTETALKKPVVVVDVLSSQSRIGNIIAENVVAKVEEKRVKKDEILPKFTDASKVTRAEVKRLVADLSIKRQDLAVLFKEVLRVQFGIKRGSIPVGKGGETRIMSTCTAAQLADYLDAEMKKKAASS